MVIAIDRLWAGLSKRIRFVRQSQGSTQPAASNRTAHDRAINRRVEIFLPVQQPTALKGLRTGPGALELAREASVGSMYHEEGLERLMGGARPKVVFLPGIMGSILTDLDVPTAGASGRGSTRAFFTANVLKSPTYVAFIAGVTLALGPAAAGAITTWLLNCDMHVIWGEWEMLPWIFIQDKWCKRLLQVNGLRDPGLVKATGVTTIGDRYGKFLGDLKSCTDSQEFPYDWRLSMDESARLLEARFTTDWWWKDQTDEQRSAIPQDDKVTIVAHSMGGLVARNFIESRKGHRFVKRLITVGTPHDGAPETFSHFHGKTIPLKFELPFAAFLTLGLPSLVSLFSSLFAGISGLSAVIPKLAVVIPKLVIPLLMTRNVQLELVRSFAGVIQLLPNSPFVSVGGSPPEPLASSYAKMVHLRTGTPVLGASPSTPGIIDFLRGGLKTPASLDSWLGDPTVNMKYHTLAGDGLETITGFKAVGSGTMTRNIRKCETGTTTPGEFRDGSPRTDTKGDKTVPLASAQLTAGTKHHSTATLPGCRTRQFVAGSCGAQSLLELDWLSNYLDRNGGGVVGTRADRPRSAPIIDGRAARGGGVRTLVTGRCPMQRIP
jgi:hypothetical protein